MSLKRWPAHKDFGKTMRRHRNLSGLLPPLAIVTLLTFALLGAPALTPSSGVPAAPQTDSQSLLATADSVLSEMSQITSLAIKAPLKKKILRRAQIREYLQENLHAEYTPREIHVQEAVLQAFGLVSRDFDLEKFLLSFYTEQAAGVYDPRGKTMFIADWISPEMQRLVLAHELTHALQDQNFDLEKFLRAARDNDDATNARQAVAEGYATAAMMQYLVNPIELASFPSLEPLMAQITHQQFQEFPSFSNAPFFFRLQALFPYAQGLGFMQRGLSQGGWKELNALFSHPPMSTKEIFDPQVYFDLTPLPNVSLHPPPCLASVPGMRLLTENVMGELGYYALLGQFISEDEARTVSTGWLADRYILYEGPGAQQYALVVRTRWSCPEMALAFFRDYHSILAKKYPVLAPEKLFGTDLFVGSIASGRVILLRKGDEVLWADAVPAAQTEAMLNFLRSL